jgi:uncharacterized protein YukE
MGAMPSPILQDPRVQDLLAAVPADVESLAAAFAQAAADASAIGQEVAAAASDPVWQGPAAGAFRQAVAPLPGEMSRVVEGYGAVAAALTGYAGDLAELTGALRALLGALEGEGPSAASARAAARRILDAFEVARDGCRGRIAAAQGSAPAVTPPASGSVSGSGSGQTIVGAGSG